jgi:hypothetical protein
MTGAENLERKQYFETHVMKEKILRDKLEHEKNKAKIIEDSLKAKLNTANEERKKLIFDNKRSSLTNRVNNNKLVKEYKDVIGVLEKKIGYLKQNGIDKQNTVVNKLMNNIET